MPYSSKETGALTALRFRLLSLVLALAALIFLSAPLAQAQDQPPAGLLRGILPPPTEEGYPTQPVPPPTQSTPKAPDQKEEPSRPPFTVFPPPESPYAVDMAKLGLRVVSAGAVDRIISLAGGAQRKPLEPGPGKKLVVATLQGKAPGPIRMPIAILDFSAFWVEEHVRELYGKQMSERVVQVVRAVALETPKGWLIEGEGLPGAALFFFIDPGPISLRVGFLLPIEVRRFGIRYPLVADGDAILAAGTPPVKN